MARHDTDEYGEKNIVNKKAANKVHRRADHKHVYQDALLKQIGSDYLDLGKYCTVCGRAVVKVWGMVKGADGCLHFLERSDYPELPVVEFECCGRVPWVVGAVANEDEG